MPELNGPPTTTRTPSRHAARQQLGQRRLVEQRVAAGEQQNVEVGVRERVDAHLPVVDAEAVALDGTLGLEARQRGNRAVHRLAKALRLGVAMRVARDVVDEHVVDGSERKPLQAVLDAAQRAVERIVPALHEWQDADVAVLVPRRIRIGDQQAADLRRQQKSSRGAARNAAPIRCSDKPLP